MAASKPAEPASAGRLTLLSVHPHPDDESIACGGVLARAASEGQRVAVVTCTGGEAGANLAGIDLGDEDLVSHRRRELADALAVLGVDEHYLLGYRDSGMAGTPDNDAPGTFHQADLYEAAARLARIVRQVQPQVVVSDDSSGTYGHPDHVKAHRVVVRAVALAGDAWWQTPEAGPPWQVAKRYVHTLSRERLLGLHRRLVADGLASPFGDHDISEPSELPFGVPDAEVTTRVDVRPWQAQRLGAMAAHRSQIAADSFFLNLPEDAAQGMFGVEEFVLEEGMPGFPPEDDLFAGLR